MIDGIHQSMLNMAFRCGEQFRRRYLEGEIVPPSVALARGIGIHKANEVNMRQKQSSKTDLPVSDLKDAARDSYVSALRNGIYLSREDRQKKPQLINSGLSDTIKLTSLYHKEVAPEIQPIETEKEFCLDVGLPLPLTGRMDVQEKPILHDLKGAGKSWAEGQINKEIQPVVYSFAYERETGIRPLFKYHILVALKKEAKRQVQELRATDQHYFALFAKLYTFINMLKTGMFPPANPTSWWCSEKFCGYFLTCPFIGNPLPKKWV